MIGGRRPAYRGRDTNAGFRAELREPVASMAREKHKRGAPRGESTEAKHWGGAARSSVETAVMAGERRGGVIQQTGQINRVTGRNRP